MSTSPLTPFEDLEQVEAERFARALDALERGGSSDIDPREDPTLYGLLETVDELDTAMRRTSPRPGYRTRSRALLMDAAEPGFLRRVARAGGRRIPFYDRRSFLVPFATAAAAAGITIAAMLGAGILGPADDQGAPAMASSSPVQVAPATAEAAAAVAEPNLTKLSISQDLESLRTSLDAVLTATGRGEDVDPKALRSIAESNLMVTTLIEGSPERLSTDEVIVYYQTAAETTIRLGELAQVVGDGPALVTARSSSEVGVDAAAAHLVNVQQQAEVRQVLP
ncbi:MAG: hypothetical protein R3C39_04135 [Dehalococcoidia bacterium]